MKNYQGRLSKGFQMKNPLHMLIGCGLHMLLIFGLPHFGVGEEVTLAKVAV